MIDKQQLEKELKQTSITKKVDKKEFINILKAINSNFVDIIFQKDSNQIIVMHPRTYDHVIYHSKN